MLKSKKETILLIVCYNVLTIISVTDSQDTRCQTKCYQSVNKSYTDLVRLIQRFKNATTDATYPAFINYKGIENLLSEQQKLEKSFKKNNAKLLKATKKLEDCNKNDTNNQNLINKMLLKVKSIKTHPNLDEINNILDNLKNKYEYLKTVVVENVKASNECEKSTTEFDKLKTDVDELLKSYGEWSKDFSNKKSQVEKLNKDVKIVNKEVLENLKKFEDLKIPSAVFEYYLKEAEIKINNSFNQLVENKNMLQELLIGINITNQDDIRKRIDEVKKLISQLQEDLKSMNKILQQYDKAIPKEDYQSLDERVLSTVKIIKDLLKILKERMKKFQVYLQTVKQYKIDINNRLRYLDNVLLYIHVRINEYLLFFATLPLTEQKMKMIEEEIWKSKETVRLLMEKKELEEDVEHLNKICEELGEFKCPNPSVNLEN